jgi:hypothetical protein
MNDNNEKKISYTRNSVLPLCPIDTTGTRFETSRTVLEEFRQDHDDEYGNSRAEIGSKRPADITTEQLHTDNLQHNINGLTEDAVFTTQEYEQIDKSVISILQNQQEERNPITSELAAIERQLQPTTIATLTTASSNIVTSNDSNHTNIPSIPITSSTPNISLLQLISELSNQTASTATNSTSTLTKETMDMRSPIKLDKTLEVFVLNAVDYVVKDVERHCGRIIR